MVYAGTGLRGYGKLIIVKHNNSFLSAYAHNKDILVKEGQHVTRGQKIAEMVDDRFHRTARDFRWKMFWPVSDGRTLYAYYTFSYVSTLPEAKGKRVGFDGVSIMTLHDGKIAEYREVANSSLGLLDIGFAPERVAKILAKQGAHLKKQPEWQRHLA